MPRLFHTILLSLLLGACASLPDQPVDVLLLGEVHDNADGHRQRLALLEARVAAGWRPAIAMEQFDIERQTELDAALQRCADADCVIAAVGGQRWNWSFYRPVIELARRYQLPLLAANLSRNDAARVTREGFKASFSTADIAGWRLDQPLPADLATPQREAIITGHCNKLPANMVEGMLNAQVARDLWMARVMTPHATRGVVLLAGNGHVRKDVGVPRWLPSGLRVQSIGFIEPGDDSEAYDRVQTLTPQDRQDPCAAFAPRR
ncbi:MAG: ChaN family lipoprotein [Rhodocyclaceae bacterium]